MGARVLLWMALANFWESIFYLLENHTLEMAQGLWFAVLRLDMLLEGHSLERVQGLGSRVFIPGSAARGPFSREGR